MAYKVITLDSAIKTTFVIKLPSGQEYRHSIRGGAFAIDEADLNSPTDAVENAELVEVLVEKIP